MDTTITTIPPAAVEALRRTVDGLIVYPTDPAYDALLAPVDTGPHRPGVVVVPATEAAVGAAVDVARVHGLSLGIASDVTVLVLTHDLDAIVVDTGARSATVGAGVTWPELRSALDGTGLHADPVRGGHSTVLASVTVGDIEPLSIRVVLVDGFVHVVADPRPPHDEPGSAPRIVTAVEIPLHTSTRQIEENQS